jgi:mannose-6-phosphate isomerase-like protein (cupin superfamily)
MDHVTRDTDTRRPRVIAPADRSEPPGQQTSAMRREEAFTGDDRWVGFVRSEPGEWSGWHHHGDTDTYFYVMAGQIEIEYGTNGDLVAFGPQDFGHVPDHLVHRERTAPGPAGELVLVRMGPGPAVINVDDPRGGA